MIHASAIQPKQNTPTLKTPKIAKQDDQVRWSRVVQNVEFANKELITHNDKTSNLKPADPASDTSNPEPISSDIAPDTTKLRGLSSRANPQTVTKGTFHDTASDNPQPGILPSNITVLPPADSITSNHHIPVQTNRDDQNANASQGATNQISTRHQSSAPAYLSATLLKSPTGNTGVEAALPPASDRHTGQNMSLGGPAPSGMMLQATVTNSVPAAPIAADPQAVAPLPMNDAGVMTAGLAASITMLHQTGGGSAVLKLNPPGLGNLSIHVAAGANAAINILFVASTPLTGQILSVNLGELRQTMTDAGLNLGDAQVSYGNGQPNFRQNQKPETPNTQQPASGSKLDGIRALA